MEEVEVQVLIKQWSGEANQVYPFLNGRNSTSFDVQGGQAPRNYGGFGGGGT